MPGRLIPLDDAAAIVPIQEANAADPSQVLVLWYTASWCKPCQRITPFVQSLVTQSAHLTVVKIDITQHPTLAAAGRVSAVPQFHFFRGGKPEGQVVGADTAKLTQKLAGLLLPSGGSGDGGAGLDGPTGSGEEGVPAPPNVPMGSRCLRSANQIDMNQTAVLGTEPDGLASVLFGVRGARLQSEFDERLLVTLVFRAPVRLQGLQIWAAADDIPDAGAPKTVLLFANQASLDLGSVARAKHAQKLDLVPTQVTATPPVFVPLKAFLFSAVTAITIYITANQTGTMATVLDGLRVYGAPTGATDISGWSTVAQEARKQQRTAGV